MRTEKFDLSKISDGQYDAVVVGAGINGAVSAAALSSCGLKVLLLDQGDFASFTSQESSNLVWGGIKYLQSYEFWLVFKLSLARARLMKEYPNRVRKIGFVAALGPNAPFGPLLGTLGTLVYWAIGLFSTPAPRTFGIKAALDIEPKLSQTKLRGAVRYFDGMLPDNDSRFVWDFVSKAMSLGADAQNYARVDSATREGDRWVIKVTDVLSGETVAVTAKAIVNAAGPMASSFLSSAKTSAKTGLVFSKGIHLVVPRLTKDDRVLAFWDEQNRLFYVIPMGDRSVIGTTDTRVANPETEVNDEDRDFVLRQINLSLDLPKPLTKADIIAERSGVRALVVGGKNAGGSGLGEEVDWHKLSRKHVIEVDKTKGMLSIFGGKLTDCLNVGAEVIAEFKKMGFSLEQKRKWYGEDSGLMPASFLSSVEQRVETAEKAGRIAKGLWRRHGSKAQAIIAAASAAGDNLDEVFEGTGITFVELKHVIATERVMTAEDLLRRRLPIAMTRSAEDIANNKKLQEILKASNLA
jgi:glycerol-3-phosphate dehydrogenase